MSQIGFRSEIGESELVVTPAARAELQRVYADCDDPRVCGIRLFVAGQGCSGMTYALTFADCRHEHDHVLALASFAFPVFVDAIALSYLRGAQMDFQRREGGDSFVFRNVFTATGGSGLCGGCGAAA